MDGTDAECTEEARTESERQERWGMDGHGQDWHGGARQDRIVEEWPVRVRITLVRQDRMETASRGWSGKHWSSAAGLACTVKGQCGVPW